MKERKWPTSCPDFKKLGTNEEFIIRLKGNSNIEKEFLDYALKFKNSAHILTEYVLDKGDISKLDIYFFSLAYLYRHSLELVLKAIGFKYICESKERESFIKDTFHNLSSILIAIKPFVSISIERNKSAYTWLEAFFKDMNDMDKESDSFRYPFGITVKRENIFEPKQFAIKPFFNKQTHIDLISFVNKMEIAFDILENCYSDSLNISEDYKDYNPVFLEEGGNYYQQSVLGYSYNRYKFHPYVTAYTDSAKYFYKCISDNKDLKNSLFIPMCYLYRNGLELALKEIIFEECSHNLQEALEILNKRKHSILRLWKEIEAPVVKHANPPEHDTTLSDVQKYIDIIHKFDGSSDKFRYPVDKYLNLHFKNGLKLDI